MRNLIEFLSQHFHWFLFVVLEVISLVLLFRFNSYQGSVWFSSANVVAGKVYEVNAEIDAYFHLTGVNQRLTERNVQLEQQVRKLREQLHDSTAATDTLRNSLPDNIRLIPAKVVDNSVDKPDNYITIDKGTADGIRTDMGVVCGTGVVGIVFLTNRHYSVVIPVLHSKSNISCSIQDRDYFGYLHWNGGAADRAYVDDIPRHAKFRVHDKVVTSGYSAVFPPGVQVGEVTKVGNSADGLSYRLEVKLSTDFARLRDVCVIDDPNVQERLELLQKAQDTLKLKQAL